MAEARLGEQVGVTGPGTADRLAAALEAARLPSEPPAGLDPHAFLRALALDKKRAGGVVEYTLLAEIGRPAQGERWSQPVPDEVVRGVLFGR